MAIVISSMYWLCRSCGMSAMTLPHRPNQGDGADVDRVRHLVAHRHVERRHGAVRFDHGLRGGRGHVSEPGRRRELPQKRGVSLNVHRAAGDPHPHGGYPRGIGGTRIPLRATLLLVRDTRQPGVGREGLRDLVEDVRPNVAVGVDAADHVDLGDERVPDPLRLALLGDHRIEPPLLDLDRHSVEHTGRVCVVASEEEEQPIPVQVRDDRRGGKNVLLYDPLDGSSNIGVNVSIGTIFSIHRRSATKRGPGSLADCLQKGRNQVAAGYILYGSSTMLVYTTGQGVHGFTLDPTIGEFLLSHPDIRSPDVGTYYSVNESHWNKWAPGVQRVVGAFKNGDSGRVEAKNARYIGSLVADIHRNLMSGGVFLYPADTNAPQGKLRLLYEAAPLAYVVEQAGGAAIDGERDILDIKPSELHQRTPLIIGSKRDVAYAHSVLSAR